MAEHRNGREAIDRLTHRILEQSRRDAYASGGRPIDHNTARDLARDSAIRTDRKHGR